MVRDVDLPVLNANDSRRLEVVVDGLPLFGGSQLAVDTTLVCFLHCDGSPHNGAADTDGVIFPGASAKSGDTQSWWDLAVALAWSCWLWMWVAGGRRSRAHSSLSWRRHRLDESRVSCRGGPSRVGGRGGEPSSLAPLRRQSQHVSLRCAQGSDRDTLLSWEVPPPRRVGCVRVR